MSALTLTFLGSHVSYEPTYLPTPVDNSQETKYRGQRLEIHEPIVTVAAPKGLKYRGIAY